MSTIRFKNLPAWVNWLAQDADGTWWGFEVEPNLSHCGWYENELGRYLRITSAAPNPYWEDTLHAVSQN